MQLDFTDDDIRDHTPLDAKVYAAAGLDCNNAPPSPAFILAAVAVSAPDNLDRKFLNFETAGEIVAKYSLDPDGDENSNLGKLLGSCWRRGEFRKIRCLSEHSFTKLLFLAISYRTAEILWPMPAQTNWENSDRYT
jgi:hypothetical protein